MGRGSVLAALKKQTISSNGESGNGDVAPPVTTLRGSADALHLVAIGLSEAFADSLRDTYAHANCSPCNAVA